MTRTRRWWKTLIGVVLTAIMLFPVYWMVNVSLTPAQDLRKSPPSLLPLDPTFDGYAAVLQQQLPFLGTSLLVGIGTVLLTLLLSAIPIYLAQRLSGGAEATPGAH